MTDSVTTHWQNALGDLLTELIDGPPAKAAYILNPGDRGLLRALDGLSADAASMPPPKGGATIAAHVDHLGYGFGLLNRWQRGEPNPFADSDYAASWKRVSVSETDWRELRERLRREISGWRGAVAQPIEPDDEVLKAVISSVIHLAYHFGAIRQIDRSTSGPRARD